MSVTIEKVPYGGWDRCWRVTNGEVELIVTADVGPRIIRFGFVGGQNLFKEYAETVGKSGEPEWQLRGGHRLWIGPEDRTRTYAPDNDPVEVEVHRDVLVATQPVEELTGIQKQIEVRLAETGSGVDVLHRMTNRRAEPIELAPWSISMMAQGGVGITGFPPRGTHPEMLEPTNTLTMWAFTDLADPRWTFMKKYLALKQDPQNPAPQKLGHFNVHTWGAYLLGSELFIKRYRAIPGLTYPDMNCSFEIFTRDDMLELETLGPMETLGEGESLLHVEHWTLHRDVTIPILSGDVLDRTLLPLL